MTTQAEVVSTRFTRTTRVMLSAGIVLLLAGAALGVSWINRPTVSVPAVLNDGDYVRFALGSKTYHLAGCRRLPDDAPAVAYRAVKNGDRQPCSECLAPFSSRPARYRQLIVAIVILATGALFLFIGGRQALRRSTCPRCGMPRRGGFCAKCGMQLA